VTSNRIKDIHKFFLCTYLICVFALGLITIIACGGGGGGGGDAGRCIVKSYHEICETCDFCSYVGLYCQVLLLKA